MTGSKSLRGRLRGAGFCLILLFLHAACSPPPSETDGGLEVDAAADAALDAGPPGPVLNVHARVRLEVDAAAATTSRPPTLSWTVETEGVGDATLALLVVAPGEPMAADPPRYLSPGVAPATGQRYWRTSDGAWQDEATSFGSAADGTLTVDWPSDAEGEWRFVLFLESGDDILDVREVEVLRADTPTIALDITRLAASPEDTVSASITLAAGATAEAVSVAAWLRDPSGEITALPPAADGALYEGPSRDLRWSILSSRFTVPGTYRIGARLVDESGDPLGFAEASFTVCEGVALVRGQLRDESGAPIQQQSSGALVASVTAIDVADGVSTVATLAADGSYEIALDGGTYRLLAQVIDPRGAFAGWGDVRVAGACEGDASVDLIAGEPRPVDADAVAAQIETLGEATTLDLASDGMTKPRVFMTIFDQRNSTTDAAGFAVAGAPTAAEENALDAIGRSVARSNPSVVVLWRSGGVLGDTMRRFRDEQLSGSDQEPTPVDLDALVAADFVIGMEVRRYFNGRLVVDVSVHRVFDSRLIARFASSTFATDADLPRVVPEIAFRIHNGFQPPGPSGGVSRTLLSALRSCSSRAT